MSRRSPNTEFLHVAVDIMCPSGHRVGAVYKFAPKRVRAGEYRPDGNVNFQDVADPNTALGRVRGTCSSCGADVIVLWERVKLRLDQNENSGRHTDELHP